MVGGGNSLSLHGEALELPSVIPSHWGHLHLLSLCDLNALVIALAIIFDTAAK